MNDQLETSSSEIHDNETSFPAVLSHEPDTSHMEGAIAPGSLQSLSTFDLREACMIVVLFCAPSALVVAIIAAVVWL